MNITMTVRTLATPTTPSSVLTTITMEDLIVEDFHLHKSLCDDEYFHFGGCIASSIRFTTTKMTYDNNGTPTPINWKNVMLDLGWYGVFFPQEYTERVNHTRVEILAYDAMYKLSNLDMSAWYAQLCRDYPEGTQVVSVLNSALAEALPRMPYDYNAQIGLTIDSGVPTTSLLYWRPYAMVVNSATGRSERTPILSGTIKMGTILKGICQVLGYNAIFETNYVSSESKYYNVLHLVNMLETTGTLPPEINPTDYSEFDYSSLDPTIFTDVKFGAYGEIFSAGGSDTKTYGITGNWCANAASQFEDEDGQGVLRNDLEIHATALLQAFQAAYIFSKNRPYKVVALGSRASLGKRARIYDTNDKSYTGRVMQEDIDGLVGARYTYVCLPTEDYFIEQDFGAYNDNNERLTELSGKVSRDELATVATTGNYNDLSNKPSLATVATSGSYNDLSNKPSIPDVSGKVDKTGDTITGTLILSKTTDASGTADNRPALIVGGQPSEPHLEMDGNEIIAKTDATHGAVLYLNNDGGGGVVIGGALTTGGAVALGASGSVASGVTTAVSGGTVNTALGSYIKKSVSGDQTVETTSALNTGFYFKSGTNRSNIGFKNSSGAILGYLGVGSDAKPYFYDSAYNEIALVKDVVSKAGDTITGTLILSKTQDASGVADNRPALIVGGTPSQAHIEMDGNEIVAKSDATHGAALYLNWDGGGVVYTPAGGLYCGSYRVLTTNDSVSWSGGTIVSSGNAYSSSSAEVGWYAGFGSTRYLALIGGKSSGKTGLLDVVADTWVLEGANSTSGYNKWIYHGKLGTNRFQCGSAQLSSGSQTLSFGGGAMGGVPIVVVGLAGTQNAYVRVTARTASGFTVYASAAADITWMAYYNG